MPINLALIVICPWQTVNGILHYAILSAGVGEEGLARERKGGRGLAREFRTVLKTGGKQVTSAGLSQHRDRSLEPVTAHQEAGTADWSPWGKEVTCRSRIGQNSRPLLQPSLSGQRPISRKATLLPTPHPHQFRSVP